MYVMMIVHEVDWAVLLIVLAYFYLTSRVRWLLMASGGFWRLLMASGGFWRLLAASDGF